MKAYVISYRMTDESPWELYSDNLTGRPVLFFDYAVARDYALDSSDRRLRYQFSIESNWEVM